jgi:branched-chain amino acid transport system ATP-binding protein
MLELAHLAVDHGSQRALWDVSLEVCERELVGLLGANGAGKSTTLGAIIGLYPLAGGTVRYAGEDIGGRPTSRNVAAGIALVPEGRRLFAEMTVAENLAMGAYAPAARRGLAAALGRVFELFPVLAQKQRQNAWELSGGQQQMVAIGRALMSSPKLLLLDEPFIGVAPLLVEEILQVLRRIASGGVTMLLVEQNIHRALDFVERAYVIENGRTVLAGSREELVGNPEFNNKFLGLD